MPQNKYYSTTSLIVIQSLYFIIITGNTSIESFSIVATVNILCGLINFDNTIHGVAMKNAVKNNPRLTSGDIVAKRSSSKYYFDLNLYFVGD